MLQNSVQFMYVQVERCALTNYEYFASAFFIYLRIALTIQSAYRRYKYIVVKRIVLQLTQCRLDRHTLFFFHFVKYLLYLFLGIRP
jgi:hypothetical protein